MASNEEKQCLCIDHHDLLHLIHHYGCGAMLLPQLRTLALRLELYPSEAAIGRAVRSLKSAGVLKRMTWLDGRSELLVGCKYMFRYFAGAVSSQEVAAAKKYNTARQYMAQCCKVDYLLRTLDHYQQLRTLEDVEHYLKSAGSTLFLRTPELPEYFAAYPPYSRYDPAEHAAQLDELRRLAALRSRVNDPSVTAPPAPLMPVLTLDTLHRRGVYVAKITQKSIILVRYDYVNTLTAPRILDWTLDAYDILHPLLPNLEISFRVQALDELGQAHLVEQLSAPYRGLTYTESRLSARHIDSGLSVIIQNSNVMDRWLGGVHVLL